MNVYERIVSTCTDVLNELRGVRRSLYESSTYRNQVTDEQDANELKRIDRIILNCEEALDEAQDSAALVPVIYAMMDRELGVYVALVKDPALFLQNMPEYRAVPLWDSPLVADWELDGPARIGNTTFRKGVSALSVVERAQREYRYMMKSDSASEQVPQEAVLPCPFCGSHAVDPAGWLDGDGRRGPECESCGATASSLAEWNMRQAQFPIGVLRQVAHDLLASAEPFDRAGGAIRALIDAYERMS